MQDSWLSKKADEIQSFADRKDMKKFFDALKTIYGPQSSGTTPLLSADGTSLLTDKKAIFHIMWRKEAIPQESMQHLSTYSKGKGILKSVTIIEASLYCNCWEDPC